ncbi:MAG: SDR family NAD(P)-dependent oxidoreductase [Planctomycetes bacterium]|nr:SDR family NAD(P)-dependent oxidoreductase [Planctomycetota bacterium]
MADLAGKTMLVTGAGGGMGREVALALAARGAHVIAHGRDEARVKPTLDAITRAGGKAEPAAFDLASLAATRAGAAELASRHKAIHGLVNNAGFWAGSREVTTDGHERTWAINVLAPFALWQGLAEPLRAGNGRVVNVASVQHEKGRIHWDDHSLAQGFGAQKAYRQSKLALVMLTNELARREKDLRANAVHPGVIATDLFRNMPWIVGVCIGAFCPSPEKGARTIWRLAAEAEFADTSGQYFHKANPKPPHKEAQDAASCARLWDVVAGQVRS